MDQYEFVEPMVQEPMVQEPVVPEPVVPHEQIENIAVAPPMPVQIPMLPQRFCVHTTQYGREGYYLIRWTHSGFDQDNKRIHCLKPDNHLNRFYNIASRTITPYRWNEIITKKNNGTVSRPMRWSYTDKYLRFDDTRIPVLRITPYNVLPSIKATSFIPISAPVAPVAPLAPVAPVAPLVPLVPKPTMYKIETIPQHVIRALLRDAAMYEEECPITSVDIDITNGAVTSCFHIFEKDAIQKWLSLPNSREKCPICNTPCNSYTLD